MSAMIPPITNTPVPAPPFAQQRILFFALVLGVVAMAGVIAFLTNEAGAAQPGEPPPEDLLGPYVVPVATALAAAAFLIRGFLHGKADAAAGEERRRLRFRATFLPLVLLEGGALFGLIAWLQARKEQPGLIAALVLLAGMLAIIPLQDRDEAAR